MSGKSLKMNRKTAELLSSISLNYVKDIMEILAEVERSKNLDELTEVKTVVGKIMGEIYIAAFYPIFETYPDMKPPEFP